MAEFKVQIKCMWNTEVGEFEIFAEEKEDDSIEDEDVWTSLTLSCF